MISSNLAGSAVPFARRWHVIHEIDLIGLVAAHARLRGLCDRLSACAEALPGNVSPTQVTALRKELTELVCRHEQGEEAFLDDMFGCDLGTPLADALLDHVRLRHVADAENARGLIAALAPGAGSAGLVRQALHRFTDGCRRAMEFEELAILTLGRHRLTPDAEALLVEGLRQRTG